MTDQCSTCFYYRSQTVGGIAVNGCHRDNPICSDAPGSRGPVAVWPQVPPDGWCGNGADAVTGRSFLTVTTGIVDNGNITQFVTATEGGTATCQAAISTLILDPSSISNYTIILPPNPVDGQRLTILIVEAITSSLTWSTSDGSSLVGFPAVSPAGIAIVSYAIVAQYYAATNTWYA